MVQCTLFLIAKVTGSVGRQIAFKIAAVVGLPR
jgi:hypothetical protein